MSSTKTSAGLLLFRRRDSRVELFLVHPGGPYWQNKDVQAWSVPKGEPKPGEALLDAAQREFREETGIEISCPVPIRLAPQKSQDGKIVHIWAQEGDCDAENISSNSFMIEWPPRSGRMQEFPEVDRGQWFGLDEARGKLHAWLAPLIDDIVRRIA